MKNTNLNNEQTIKQASEYYAHNYFDMHETNNYKALKEGFIAGAKWQAERMYNAELDFYIENQPILTKEEEQEQMDRINKGCDLIRKMGLSANIPEPY